MAGDLQLQLITMQTSPDGGPGATVVQLGQLRLERPRGRVVRGRRRAGGCSTCEGGGSECRRGQHARGGCDRSQSRHDRFLSAVPDPADRGRREGRTMECSEPAASWMGHTQKILGKAPHRRANTHVINSSGCAGQCAAAPALTRAERPRRHQDHHRWPACPHKISRLRRPRSRLVRPSPCADQSAAAAKLTGGGRGPSHPCRLDRQAERAGLRTARRGGDIRTMRAGPRHRTHHTQGTCASGDDGRPMHSSDQHQSSVQRWRYHDEQVGVH